MSDKQKVTLYIPPGLHRQLKIRAAVDAESMSELVERALVFYLKHPEVVDRVEVYGQTYQVHQCPECDSSLVMQDGQLATLKERPTVLADELPEDKVAQQVQTHSNSQGEEELVPC